MDANHDSRSHAVVIGSGFGGLAAAVRLGARGYRVTILERLDQPGGRARVFSQDGFTFDAGPTVITAPFLFEELWELCGRRLSDDVDLRPVHPFYRIRLSPDDEAGYDRFLAMSERIFNVGFTRLGHIPFDSVWSMARIVPDMIRLQSHLTVYRLVARFIKHPKLRQALSFHPLLVGGNPFTTTSIYTLIAYLEREWGVHFPIGGSGELVRGLLDLIDGLGGELRLNADVAEVVVEGGKARGIRLTDGETIQADVVISNADSAWLYRHLVPASARNTRWACLCGTSERAAATRRLRTTPSSSGHDTRDCWTTSSQRGSRRTSASTCTDRPLPILHWRRTERTPSTSCRPFRTSRPPWIGPSGRSRTGRRSRTTLPTPCCRGWATRSSPRE